MSAPKKQNLFLRVLDRLEESLITFLIAAATIVIFVSVTHRYSLGLLASAGRFGAQHDMPWLLTAARSAYFALSDISLTWAQELCIFMFVWMAKFGAAYGVRTGIHVGVDILVNAATPPVKRLLILFGLACGAVFTATVGVLGSNFVWHMAHMNQTSPDLEAPMWLVYLAIPVGSFLMCFRFLQVLVNFARTGLLPHGHEVEVEGLDAPAPEKVEAR